MDVVVTANTLDEMIDKGHILEQNGVQDLYVHYDREHNLYVLTGIKEVDNGISERVS